MLQSVYANDQRMPRHQVKLMRSDDQNPPDQFLQRLGLAPNCKESDVRTAYLRLAKTLHPDHGGDAHVFQQLQADYEAALKYVRTHQAPKVHSFFLSPWNKQKQEQERVVAFLNLGVFVCVLLLASIIAILISDAFILPLLVLGIGYLWIHLCVMSNLPPGFAASSVVCGVLLTAFSLLMLVQDGFFSSVMRYSTFDEVSGSLQLQMGLLAFSVLLVVCSGLSLIAALADRW